MGKLENYLKILFLILFFSVFAYFSSYAEKGKKTQKEKISVEKVFEIFKRGECFFVDARSVEEFKNGHIEGAINIPYHSDKKDLYISKAVDFLNGAKFVVVYCDGSGCGLSKLLAKDLINAGVDKKKIVVFTEGYEIWLKKGYPVSKDLSFQKALFSFQD